MKKMLTIILILVIIFIGMYTYKKNKNQNTITITEVQKIEEYISKIYMWQEVTNEALPKFNNINEVEKYKNAELYVTREDAIDLEEGEYFICDLIGLDVVDEDSNVIGKLTDVLQSAANDVYEITDNSGKTHLFPAIKECVLNVNLDEGRMYVHVMKGLMDL